MKIVLDPVYTTSHMSTCSSWFPTKLAGLKYLEMDENNYIYCLVPDEEYCNDGIKADDLVDHPRWKNIKYPYSKDRYSNFFFPGSQYEYLLANYGELWDYDILFTTRSFCLPLLRASTREERGLRWYTLLDLLPGMNFKTTVSMWWEGEAFLSLAYAMVDRVFMTPEWERKEALKTMRKYISPNLLMKAQDKMRITYYHPDLDYERVYKKKIRQDEVLNVIYAGRRNNTQKKWDDIVKLFRYYWLMRKEKINFFVASASKSQADAVEPMWDMKSLPRDEFYTKLENQDVTISMSIEEEIPLALVEAISYGCIPVVRKAQWSVGMFGEDYFGLVKNEAEAFAMLDLIAEDKQKYFDMFLEWYEKFKEEYLIPYGDFKQNLLDDVNALDSRRMQYFEKKFPENEETKGWMEMCSIINDNLEVGEEFNLMEKMAQLGKENKLRYGPPGEFIDILNTPLWRRPRWALARYGMLYKFNCVDNGTNPGDLKKIG